MERECKDKGLTGAKGVVRPLELLAGSVVLALGGNALEVVGVVLEAEEVYVLRPESKCEVQCNAPVPRLVGVRETSCRREHWHARALRRAKTTNRQSPRSGGCTCCGIFSSWRRLTKQITYLERSSDMATSEERCRRERGWLHERRRIPGIGGRSRKGKSARVEVPWVRLGQSTSFFPPSLHCV